MAELSLDLERHRDLKGREDHVWARRVTLMILGLISIFAVLNGFGQRASTATSTGAAAQLQVHSPERVRGGLLYQARITVKATQRIKRPRLVLDSGWFDGLTINTVQPDPSEHVNRNGRVGFLYDQLDPGKVLTVWIQYQVNPTTIGNQTQRVELDDGGTPLAQVERQLTVLP